VAELGRVLLAVVWLAIALSASAASQVDIRSFPSPEAEARYRALIDELRCPKCLNTNLSGSDAEIARDLRATVHRLIVEEGMSDQEIRDYLQARYGDFVLYDPPFKPGTWLLWLLPLVFLGAGAVVLIRLLRPRPQVVLEEPERERIRSVLDELEERS
jgi:cytochrome c-type biogenesis protein CcmH